MKHTNLSGVQKPSSSLNLSWVNILADTIYEVVVRTLGPVSSTFWVSVCLSLTATTWRADEDAEVPVKWKSWNSDPDISSSLCAHTTHHITRVWAKSHVWKYRAGSHACSPLLPLRACAHRCRDQSASPALLLLGQIKWKVPEGDDETQRKKTKGCDWRKDRLWWDMEEVKNVAKLRWNDPTGTETAKPDRAQTSAPWEDRPDMLLNKKILFTRQDMSVSCMLMRYAWTVGTFFSFFIFYLSFF